MAAKPFESRIQDLVYNVDVGIGLKLTQVALYLLFVLVTMLLYTATQFRGLKDAAAMDYGQLGHNLATRHRFITQNIRPASLWYLNRKTPGAPLRTELHPDIVNAPLWPAVLAGGFKALHPPFVVDKPGKLYAPEQWVMIPLGHLFTLLTGLVMFFFGQRLFDRRVAVLAVTIFVLSDTVWRNSISGLGLSLVMFLVVTACYLVHRAAAPGGREGVSSLTGWGKVAVIAAALLCSLAFLTRYAAAVVAPALALYIGWSFRKKGWLWAAIFMAVFLAGISPWLARNAWISGNPLGLAPLSAMNETTYFEGNAFDRNLAPEVPAGKVWRELQTKWMTGLGQWVRRDAWSLGEGLFFALFLAALFYRFISPPVHRLRWCLILAMLLLGLVAPLYGAETARLMTVFWPLVIIYGLAFFFILLDRLQLPARLFDLGTTTLVVVLSALPLIFALLPPRVSPPYPPYYPPFVAHVSKMLAPDEMMCTDMPWATAWYGDKTSLLLPATLDQFYEINDYHRRVYGLYFTTLSRNKPYVSGLVTGPEKSWFPILEGRIPTDFPLNQGFPLNGLDQLFLTDRVRWGP